MPFQTVRAAGAALLLFGALMGPGGGLLTEGLWRWCAPLAGLALGWVGARFGARLDRRRLREIDGPAARLAALQAAASFVAVAAGVWALTTWQPALLTAWGARRSAALVLGAIAAVSGPGMWSLLTRGSVPPPVGTTLAAVTLVDTALGTIVCALSLIVANPSGGPVSIAMVITRLLLTAGSGALVGLVFLSLTRVRHAPADVALALTGCLLLGAGAGSAGGLVPFTVCAVAGAVIVNLSPHEQEIVSLLERWESPALAAILVVAGVLLRLPTWWIVPAALVLALGRIGVRWLVTRLGRRPLGAGHVPADAGLAGVAQGAIALALGVSVALRDGAAVLTTVVLGVAVTQLVAPAVLARATRAAPLTPETQAPEVTG